MESNSTGLHRDASQLLIVTAVHVAELVIEGERRGKEMERKRKGEGDILRRMEREREEVRV